MKVDIPMSDGSVYTGNAVKVVEPVQTTIQLYFKPHDPQIRDYDNKDFTYLGSGDCGGPLRGSLVDSNARSLPEVYKCLYPEHQVPLSDDWLKLWWGINPDLTQESFEKLLDNSWAWTNNTGWPGRYNYLTGEGKGLPAFSTVLFNGGGVVTGIEKDGWLYIETMRAGDKPPPADYVLERPWLWCYATEIGRSRNISFTWRKNKYGGVSKVRKPHITVFQVRWPLTFFKKLKPGSEIPYPLTLA